MMLSARNTFLAKTGILDAEPHPQDACPLLHQLPPEVRARIWAFALTDYPDPSPKAQYERTISWSRPGYTSPRIADTALLQTCRFVYQESWFLPLYCHEYVEWLTRKRFTPTGQGRLEHVTRKIRHLLRDSESKSKESHMLEISNMHFFAQASLVDAGVIGRRLSRLIPLMHPRTLTLTIRHWDWELWEAEEKPLHLGGRWISQVCRLLPSSVNEIRIELESVEREATQVRELATQMRRKWFFSRRDGVRLFAGRIDEGRWRGPSIWNRTRCYCDETEPGVIDYYMLVVVLQTESTLQRNRTSISPYASKLAQQGSVCPCKLALESTLPKRENGPLWRNSFALDDNDEALTVPFPRWTQPLRELLSSNDSQFSNDDVEAPCDCGEPHIRLCQRSP